MISVCVASIRDATISKFIDSIINQSYLDWELIISIQGENKELEHIVNCYNKNNKNIQYIKCSRYGKTLALNNAILISRGDIIAFTDDDCEADERWLEEIYKNFVQYQDAGIVAGSVIPSFKPKFTISTCPATYVIECTYDPSSSPNGAPSGFYWAGGNFAVRKKVFKKVGMFDEYLSPGTEFPGAEDMDFAYRAEANNIVMVTTPNSIINHTYGRRFGILSILKQYKNYATGVGALSAKLEISHHRLSQQKNSKKRTLFKNPVRLMKHIYDRYWIKKGYYKYIKKYKVNNLGLTIKLHE